MKCESGIVCNKASDAVHAIRHGDDIQQVCLPCARTMDDGFCVRHEMPKKLDSDMKPFCEGCAEELPFPASSTMVEQLDAKTEWVK